MGWITEYRGLTFRGKTYRRKNYLLIGSIGYNVFLLMLTMPPKGLVSKAGISHWFGLTYILLFIFDTICNIPYYSFGMELATTPAGRDLVWFYNILFGLVGVLFGAGMPAGLTLF